MIKVTETRKHNLFSMDGKYWKSSSDKWLHTKEVTVADGKLVLIDKLPWTGEEKQIYFKLKGRLPIVISETEKIEAGVDWIYNLKTKEYRQSTIEDLIIGNQDWCKVLVLPEQFSAEQLKKITDSKIKDSGKVAVQCEKVYQNARMAEPVLALLPSQWDDNVKHWERIKLDAQGFVTLHELEEKTIPYSTALQLVNKMRMHCLGITPMSAEDEKIPDSVVEWFDQNTK